MAKALTDQQIMSICQGEIDNSSGYAAGDLADERTTAMDYYLFEPFGDEQSGRSSVISRDVYSTVQWCLPSLLRIFSDSDNVVSFDPTGPEDVAQAQAETDCVNHVFFKQNRSFYNLYTICSDALLSKNGILKIYWSDKPEKEREEYTGLDEIQFGTLMNDTTVEREIIEYEERSEEIAGPQGMIINTTIDVVFMTTTSKGRIEIEPIPPEEFGISREARSPYVEDVGFCYHRARKSFNDLVEMGYDIDVIRSLPADDEVETQEELARRNLNDENEMFGFANEESMREFWITECYIRVDRNGDDHAELLQVTLAAGNMGTGGGTLLGIEEVDHMPFTSASPILLTHKFYGLSIADLTVDLQRIRSALLRSMLDHTYLAGNPRVAVNDRLVNVDDLLTSRPGGIVRYKGDQGAGAYISPIPHSPLPPESFQMMEYLDEIRKDRTGVAEEVAGLDKNTLASVSPTVAALSFDAARMKIELIARIIGEVCLKPAFQMVHRLLMQHQDKEMMIQLGSKWMPMNPSEWRTRVNSTVMVGTGVASRERKMMALETVMSHQMEQVNSGGMGTTVMPHQIYQARADWANASGLEADLYYTDPRSLPPPPPAQPDVQQEAIMMQAQAMMMEAQSKMQKNELEGMKLQADGQLKMREQDLKQQEHELKAEIETLKARMEHMANESATDTKVASLELQMDKQDTSLEMQRLQMELNNVQKERDREVELYKIQTENIVKLLQAHGIDEDPEAAQLKTLAELERDESSRKTTDFMGQLLAQNQILVEQIEDLKASMNGRT